MPCEIPHRLLIVGDPDAIQMGTRRIDTDKSARRELF